MSYHRFQCFARYSNCSCLVHFGSVCMDILLPVNSLSSVTSDRHNTCSSSVSLCVPVACQNSSTADLGFAGDDISQNVVFDSLDVILPVSPSVDSSSQAIVDIDVPILQKSGIFKYWIAAKALDLTSDSLCIERNTVPVVSIKSHSDCSLHCQSNVDLSGSVFFILKIALITL